MALYVRKRVDRSGEDGTTLVRQSLSVSDPKWGRPQLTNCLSPQGVSDDTARPVQDGAAAFGRGCMLGIRNVHSRDDVDLDATEALATSS